MKHGSASVVALAAALTVLAITKPAQAWYFPEHVVLTEQGVAGISEITPAWDVLSAAWKAARDPSNGSLRLCEQLEAALYADAHRHPVHVQPTVDCTPYGALPAMAGDHADDAFELLALLDEDSELGMQMVRSSRELLGRFVADYEDAEPSPERRRTYVQSLDAVLFLVDDRYTDRASKSTAHFQAAGVPMEVLLRDLVTKGRTDNALAQFLGHHLRSLSLAMMADTSDPAVRRALSLRAWLEHGFALHYLQDAFSTGHVAVPTTLATPEERKQRHDFDSRNGMALTHALGVQSCASDRSKNGARSDERCWLGHGDGFLSVDPESPERRHLSRAMQRAQIQLALAFDLAAAEALLDEQICPKVVDPRHAALRRIADLLDPLPDWTLSPRERSTVSRSCRRGQALLRGAIQALRVTKRHHIASFSGNDGGPCCGLVPEDVVGAPLDLCRPLPAEPGTQVDEAMSPLCRTGEGIMLGRVDTSLVRPLLAVWPTSQARESSLRSRDPLGRGFAYQIWVASGTTVLPYDGGASGLPFWLGANAGISYRLHHLLPGRPTAALIEVNAGIVQAVRVDPGPRFPSYATLEVRSAGMSILSDLALSAVTLAFLDYPYPPRIGSTYLDFLGGARFYVGLQDTAPQVVDGVMTVRDRHPFHFDGFDLELFNVTIPAVSRIVGAERIDRLPVEVRTRVGCRYNCTTFSLGLEVTGGVARVF